MSNEEAIESTEITEGLEYWSIGVMGILDWRLQIAKCLNPMLHALCPMLLSPVS